MVKVEERGNKAWSVDWTTEHVNSEVEYVVGTFEHVIEVFSEEVSAEEELRYFEREDVHDDALVQTGGCDLVSRLFICLLGNAEAEHTSTSRSGPSCTTSTVTG